jgi:hypothetical protein
VNKFLRDSSRNPRSPEVDKSRRQPGTKKDRPAQAVQDEKNKTSGGGGHGFFGLTELLSAFQVSGPAFSFFDLVILFAHIVALHCRLDSIASRNNEDSVLAVQHLFVGVGVGGGLP